MIGAGDVAKVAPVQDRLLAAAAGLAKPGGLLTYAVRSLQPEEGSTRIAALLESGAPLERDPVGPGGLPGPAEGDLRTLPSFQPEHGGMDGFHACRLRRVE